MRREAFVFALLLALVAIPATARALTLLGHVEHYDPATDVFEFTIRFSAAPDFWTVDEFGRSKDSFQYWIVYPIDRDPFFPYITPDVLVRGDELRFGAGIPIRERTGDGGPHSGGWGPIRGTVPFVLTGNELTFAVPRGMLGDPDGRFAYYLGVFSFGGTTDFVMSISDSDPPVDVANTSWGRIKALYR